MTQPPRRATITIPIPEAVADVLADAGELVERGREMVRNPGGVTLAEIVDAYVRAGGVVDSAKKLAGVGVRPRSRRR